MTQSIRQRRVLKEYVAQQNRGKTEVVAEPKNWLREILKLVGLGQTSA